MTCEEAQKVFHQIYSSKVSQDALKLATDFGHMLSEPDGADLLLEKSGFLDKIKTRMVQKEPRERERSFIALYGIISALGVCSGPICLEHLEYLIKSCGDKVVYSRDAAYLACRGILTTVNKHIIVPQIVPYLINGLKGKSYEQQSCLELLEIASKRSPDEFRQNFPNIIPPVVNCVYDTGKATVASAIKCMEKICNTLRNSETISLIPVVIDYLSNPDSVEKCIKSMSRTTFVAEVTTADLSLFHPVLKRALAEKKASTLRLTCKITLNLFKLLKNPVGSDKILDEIYPQISSLSKSANFPDVREYARDALEVLDQRLVDLKSTANKLNDSAPNNRVPEITTISNILKQHYYNSFGQECKNYLNDESLNILFTSTAVSARLLIEDDDFCPETWIKEVGSCFKFYCKDYEPITDKVCNYFNNNNEEWLNKYGENNGNGDLICNCRFSLAYGTMMLLENTLLRLRRGHVYGMCGRNGAGKSTLMRSIYEGKVENFPPSEELFSVLIQHEIKEEDVDVKVIDYLMKCATKPNAKIVSKEEAISIAVDAGISECMLNNTMGSLSGGWRMKAKLVSVILSNADLLLLDEPTNHLDQENVKWLIEYIKKHNDKAFMIISHDPPFLDSVCTDIISYENKKLVYYKGNMSDFIKACPTAGSYSAFSADVEAFQLPPPAFLQGVNSKTKVILKATGVSYTYSGAQTPSIINASVRLSLSSRVAIVGHNGAGKSTLIKLLSGDLIPQSGEVWKHPNLRIGYIAQHSFSHLDSHRDKTPIQYILWRYKTGEDREVVEKESRRFTEEDLEAMSKPINVDGSPRFVEYLIGRQKYNKSYQYEVKWKGMLPKFNTQIPREKLLELGFQKIVQAFDDREASREGQSYRNLTPATVRDHLKGVLLDSHIADDIPIECLSDGQKVKLVIAGATWNNPHIFILDEPTNFVDRDTISSLVLSIKSWGGAIIIISHNEKFLKELCSEYWYVSGGHLTVENKSSALSSENGVPLVTENDANYKIKKKKKTKTRNELKAQEARRRARHMKWLIEGGVKQPDTDEED